MAHTAGAQLHKGLKQRHLTMIAIGGVIGAGLFVGSGVVINTAGPGAFITYAMTGVLIVMVMRMLGEMATANPSTGSFADYARQALGGWAGFSVAWLYWYFWVIVIGFEAVAGAGILQKWLPDVPLWIMSLGLLLLMTATNLYSVSSYGEFEYLVRRDQGVHHLRLSGAGRALRSRALARPQSGLLQPYRARGLLSERGWFDFLGHRGRDLLDGGR